MDKTFLILLCLYMICRSMGHAMSVDASCIVTEYQGRLVEKMNNVEENLNVVTRSFEQMSEDVKYDLATAKRHLGGIRQHSAELNTSIHVTVKGIRDETEQNLQRRNETFEKLKQQFEYQFATMKTEFDEITQELKNISAYLTKKTSHGYRFVYADILRMESMLEMFLQSQLVKAMDTTYSEIFPEFREFVREMKAKVSEPAYAFSATTVISDSPKREEPIIFTDVTMNEADVYDANNGVFTSPTNGTFKFSFTLCVAYGKSMSFQIKAGDKVVSRVMGAAQSNAVKTVTGKTVVALKRGDKVWVEALKKGYNSLCTEGYDGLNRFSGYLLH